MAAVVSAISLVALVVYTISAWKLLRFAKDQADAAREQAVAATMAIQASLSETRQIKNVGKSVVAAAIQRVYREIDYWKSINIANLQALYALPQVRLRVENETEVIQFARRISADAAGELSSAFDNLIFAEREIEILRAVKASDLNFLNRHVKSANEYLDLSKVDLDAAKEHLRAAVGATEPSADNAR